MAELGRPGAQALANELELGLGDDGGKRLLHPHRVGVVLGVCAPDQTPRVHLVSQDDVDVVLGPEPAGGVGDALVVEGAGDGQDSPARLGHAEDALHDGGGRRVWF